MKLIVANKNYSSWSFRPWLALRVKNISFEEVLIPFDMPSGNPEFAQFSPTNKVPVLQDGDLTVWESLAILEYLAERFPSAGLWPGGRADRAVARSVASEMHGGFLALRAECPMNMRREHKALHVSDDVHRDVHRITEIWRGCLDGSGGPFLFGGFTNADAMFGPVVNRLAIYRLSDDPVVRSYSEAMTSLPAWKEWQDAARAETWVVEEDEA